MTLLGQVTRLVTSNHPAGAINNPFLIRHPLQLKHSTFLC